MMATLTPVLLIVMGGFVGLILLAPLPAALRLGWSAALNGSPKQAEEKRVSLRERSEPGPAAVRSEPASGGRERTRSERAF